MTTFFDNIGIAITSLLSLFTQVADTLLENVLFQIGVAIFLIYVLISIIMSLLNRPNKEGKD